MASNKEQAPAGSRAVPERRELLLRDVLAGLSVALVLIPQSLAYAELAGLPAYYGLYAAAFPPLAAALLASSPHVQTGPTALTSILTIGILAPLATPGSPEFIAAAAILALIVGLTRIIVGLTHLGGVVYLMSQPMMMGFINAAALLILFSQFPTALGVTVPREGIVVGLGWTLGHPSSWDVGAVLLTLMTLALMLGGRKLSPFFPGVLIAVGAGLAFSLLFGYRAPVVGEVAPGAPVLAFGNMLIMLPELLIGGVVIAVVGFAEVAAIARTFVVEDRGQWDPNREFVSQGIANLAAGLFHSFPVGGSFARSSLARLAGANSRWSGAVTGLVVLALLPAVPFLSALPRAVLGAVVIGSVASLISFRPLVELWRYSKTQFTVAWSTFGLTLLLAPRIEQAVIIGIGLAVMALLWQELRLDITTQRADEAVQLHVSGVLWFGSAQTLENTVQKLLNSRPKQRTLILNLTHLARIDLSGAMTLSRLIKDAERAGMTVEMEGLASKTQETLRRLRTEKRRGR